MFGQSKKKQTPPPKAKRLFPAWVEGYPLVEDWREHLVGIYHSLDGWERFDLSGVSEELTKWRHMLHESSSPRDGRTSTRSPTHKVCSEHHGNEWNTNPDGTKPATILLWQLHCEPESAGMGLGKKTTLLLKSIIDLDEWDQDFLECVALLSCIPIQMYDEWVKIAYILKPLLGDELGWVVFRWYSSLHEDPTDHPEWQNTWHSIPSQSRSERPITKGTLWFLARETHPELFYRVLRPGGDTIIVMDRNKEESAWAGTYRDWYTQKKHNDLFFANNPNCITWIEQHFLEQDFNESDRGEQVPDDSDNQMDQESEEEQLVDPRHTEERAPESPFKRLRRNSTRIIQDSDLDSLMDESSQSTENSLSNTSQDSFLSVPSPQDEIPLVDLAQHAEILETPEFSSHDEALAWWRIGPLKLMNAMFAYIMQGAFILYFAKPDEDPVEVQERQFFSMLRDVNSKIKIVQHRQDRNGDTTTNTKYSSIPWGKQWMSNPAKKKYEKVDFDPNCTDPKVFNLYRGFPWKKIPKEEVDMEKIRPFITHIQSKWASGNAEHAHYIMSFFADIIQNPGEKPGVALVIVGEQGSGKTIIVQDIMKALLRQYHATVTDFDELAGSKFNVRCCHKLMIELNEAGYLQGWKYANKLKALITDIQSRKEKKFFDATQIKDFARYILVSNHDNIVKVEESDRRYACFKCKSSEESPEYWKALAAIAKDDDALMHLYNYLRHYTIGNLKKIPKTYYRTELQMSALRSEIQFIHSIAQTAAENGSYEICEKLEEDTNDAKKKRRVPEIDAGSFTVFSYVWTPGNSIVVPIKYVFQKYEEWCKIQGSKGRVIHDQSRDSANFGKRLNEYIENKGIESIAKKHTKRGNVVLFGAPENVIQEIEASVR